MGDPSQREKGRKTFSYKRFNDGMEVECPPINFQLMKDIFLLSRRNKLNISDEAKLASAYHLLCIDGLNERGLVSTKNFIKFVETKYNNKLMAKSL